MHLDVSFLPAIGAAFLLIFARTGTMVMLLPGLGEQNISPRLRLTIALVLAAVLLPLHRPAYHIDTSALGPTIVLLGRGNHDRRRARAHGAADRFRRLRSQAP